MRHVWLPWACALFLLSPSAIGEEAAVVGPDGAIAVLVDSPGTARERAVFRFGLPPMPAARQWREGAALRSLWETNGIRYTQTVLACELERTPRSGPGSGPAESVVLVNIEGENTRGEYTEASAELSVEAHGAREELELDQGLVWRHTRAGRVLVGGLAIPESGIKLARGPVLRFSGAMPPSLKGSMTVKILLRPASEQRAAEQLEEIEFEDEFRRAKSARPGTETPIHGRALVFAAEVEALVRKRPPGP